MNVRPVAVTGATGFLGRHVVAALTAAGIETIAIVRDRAAARRLLPRGLDMREADVRDGAALAAAMTGTRAAIHMAGLVSTRAGDGAALRQVNICGAANFLAAAQEAGLERVLFTSSTSAVGALRSDRPGAALNEEACFNLDRCGVAYVAAKRAAHLLALAARARGLPVVVLSPSFVLGPGDARHNTAALVDAIRRRRFPFCPPGGLNPIDARDLAAAYVAALVHPDPAPHYILAGRENLRLRDLATRIAERAGVAPPRLSLAPWAAVALARAVEMLHPAGQITAAAARLGGYYWYFDATRARRDLGLCNRPLDDTLDATLAWLVGRGHTAAQAADLEHK